MKLTNRGAVEKLEEALKLAQDGELRDVVIAGRLSDGHRYSSYDTQDMYHSIATIELLKHRLLASIEPEKI